MSDMLSLILLMQNILKPFMKSSMAKNGPNLIVKRYLSHFLNYLRKINFKICTIKYARIQGRNALITHFKSSSVMNQKVLFI